MQIPFECEPKVARTATGYTETDTHKTVPIEVSLRTPWGAMKLPPITFVVLPGSDDVVLFGMQTMKELGIDLYPLALEKLRPRAMPVQQEVEVSVQSFQQYATEDAPTDAAVERLVDRGPDMFMNPAGESVERERVLEGSIQHAEQSGLSTDGACRLRDILSRRVDAFHRALRGDPLAHVDPIRV